MGAYREMSMRLFIGGIRGSRPCTDSKFKIYGGDTTCLLLTGSRGQRLIMDAGTGLYAVAEQLAATEPSKVTILLSHYHLDHLAGLFANSMFFQKNWKFCFIGPVLGGIGVKRAVTELLRPPYWSVPWEQMEAEIKFIDLASEPFHINGFNIRTCTMPHPGGSACYRIEDLHENRSLIFATDIELRRLSADSKTEFMNLCSDPNPADMLIIDSYFTREEIDDFTGWGHSCFQDDLDLAQDAGIKRVLLAHHNAHAHDEILKTREQDAQKIMPGAGFACAGQCLTI